MIDFMKGQLQGVDRDELWNNDLLDFQRPISTKTGEFLENHVKAEYRNIEFRIYDSGNIYILGSLHKFFNRDIPHNFNRFTINDMWQVLVELQNKFNIKPENVHLTQFEAGFNCKTDFKADLVINSLLMYKFNPFLRVSVNNGNIKKAKTSQLEIKGYNKSKQYRLDSEIFRFEVKFRRMQYLSNKGINVFTLGDLVEPSNFNKIGHTVLNIWDEVVLSETINYQDTTLLKHFEHSKYYDFDFWTDLKEMVDQKIIGKNAMSNELNKLRKKQENNGFSLGQELSKIIRHELAIIEDPS